MDAEKIEQGCKNLEAVLGEAAQLALTAQEAIALIREGLVDTPTPPPELPVIEDFGVEVGTSSLTIHWAVKFAHKLTLRVAGELIEPPDEWLPVETVSVKLPLPGNHVARLEAANDAGMSVADRAFSVPVPPPPPPDGDVVEWSGLIEIGGEGYHSPDGVTVRIAPDAEIVFLDVPITNDHTKGELVFHGPVIALGTPDKPIRIRSANPNGRRGGIMMHNVGQWEHFILEDLGQTRTDPISATNELAHYSMHWHLAGDKSRGSFARNGTVFHTVRGYRHGIVVHGSHGVTVSDNHIHHVSGSGIYVEDGTERDVVIENNLIEDVWGWKGDWKTQQPRLVDRGEGIRGDAAWMGLGIYTRSPRATIRMNTVRRTPIGYAHFFFLLPDRATPIDPFEDNLAEECYDGYQPWHVGGNWNDPPPTGRSYIRRFTARNCSHLGIFSYPGRFMTLEDCTFEGERSHLLFGDYYQIGLEVRRCRFIGADVRPSTRQMSDEQLFSDCVWDGPTAEVYMFGLSFNNDAGTIPARHVRLVRPKFLNGAHINMGSDNLGGGNINFVQEDRLTVEDFQGTPGDSFEVYRPTQKADAILPQSKLPYTDPARLYWYAKVGCPDPNLTNAEAAARWRWYRDPDDQFIKFVKVGEEGGIDPALLRPCCRASKIVPADARARENVLGLVSPL